MGGFLTEGGIPDYAQPVPPGVDPSNTNMGDLADIRTYSAETDQSQEYEEWWRGYVINSTVIFGGNVPNAIASTNRPQLPIPLSEFLEVVADAAIVTKQTAGDIDAQDPLLFKEFLYEALASARAFLSKIYGGELGKLSDEEIEFFEQLREQVGAFNSGPLADYNEALAVASAFTSEMYNNQLAFINGTITEAEYNALVDEWNGDVDAQNDALSSAYDAYTTAVGDFNNLVAQNNAEIDQLNTNRPREGSEREIPHQAELVAAEAEEPLPMLDHSPPPITEPTVPSGFPPQPKIIAMIEGDDFQSNDFLSLFVIPTTQEQLDALDFYYEWMTRQESHVQVLLFALKGVRPNIAAFIENKPPVTPSSGTKSGSGSSATISTLVFGLDNSNLAGSISNGIVESFRTAELLPFPPQISQELGRINFSALKLLGLSASLAAFRQLQRDPELLTANGDALRATFALRFLDAVSNFADSEVLRGAVAETLSAAEIREADSEALIDPLTAALQLSLLQVAQLEVATALRLPGLLTQLTGNLENIPNRGDVLGSATAVSVGDQLKDRVIADLLKKNLTALLLREDPTIATPAAEKTVNDLIGSLLEGNAIASGAKLRLALERQLLAAGIAGPIAQLLAEEAAQFLRAEQLIGDLDAPFVRSRINEASLTNPLFAQRELQGALDRTLADQSLVTRRDFRDRIALELEGEGLARPAARERADELLFVTRSEELQRAFDSSRVDREQLDASLSRLATEVAQGLGASQDAIVAALNALFAEKRTNELLFREALEGALIGQGVAPLAAAELAAGANVSQRGAAPLRSVGTASLLEGRELGSRLATDIADRLRGETGDKFAATIGSEYVASLLEKPNSLLHLQQRAVDTLLKESTEERARALEEYFKDLVRPSAEVFSLKDLALDFGKTMVAALSSLAQRGIDSAPSPSRADTQHKRDIDILV